jgi:hypothetical protein
VGVLEITEETRVLDSSDLLYNGMFISIGILYKLTVIRFHDEQQTSKDSLTDGFD